MRLLLPLLVLAAPLAAQDPGYRVGVVSESGDIVTWARVADGRLVQDRVVPVGLMPADVDGPHNVAAAPDGRSYYVTIAHGAPYGSLWRLDARTDTLIGRADLEFFPTTIALTPDGDFAFVANSDFHGDRPRVNPVTVVYTPTMLKVADVPACDMPHGVRVNHAGTRVYVTCMMSDEILELDTGTFEILRRAKSGTGGAHAAHAGHGDAADEGECSPTFVAVAPDDARFYVACNKGNTVQVWDAARMERLRDVPVGAGTYNLEVSPDGGLVIATNKKAQSVSLVDTRTLAEVARIPTTKKIVHGVAYSPDGRYAFVTAESIGADPGSLDLLDLATRRIVSTLAIPAQPTGVAIVRLAGGR